MTQSKGKLSVVAMFVGVFTLLLAPVPAYAHVTVKPTKVSPGDYQTFTTSVPNEKKIAVTGVRLVVPENVKSVTPTVKQGWTISTKKSGESVTEVNWTGGIIDTGLRDEFTFSAQAPAEGTEIIWKAYQTYQDGSVVAWDQKPSDDHGHGEEKDKGPYSTTELSENEADDDVSDTSNTLAYVLSGIAVVVSVIALARTVKK